MPIGVSLQLFDGATQQANLSGIQALWWDVTEPKDAGKPIGKSVAVTTDATGFISLDLSNVSGLTVGAYGFLTLYQLNATNHENSLIFSGKVVTSTVTSGVNMQVVASSPAWVRNPSWLALPVVADTEQKVVGLYRVDKDANFIAFTCAAAYTVDWGDGSVAENFATGVSAYHEYSYADVDLANTNGPVTFTDVGDLVNRTAHGHANGAEVQFHDIVSTTGLTAGQTYFVINTAANTFQISATVGGAALALTTNGSANLLPYKQAVVTITPQAANNLTSVNFNVRHTAAAVLYSAGWLDVLVSGTFLSTLTLSASSGVVVQLGYLEQFQLISTNSVTNFSYMFSAFSLASIPLLNTAAGTNFASMFSNCYSLASIPLLNTAAGTDFSGMFSSCRSLASIPLLNTAAGTNFASMFLNCSSLTSIPLLNTALGTNFANMFQYCSSLASIPLLNTAAGTNFSTMFQSCYLLASIPLLNTAAGTTLSAMFQYCYSLASIPLLNTAAVTDFSGMFYGSYSLTSIPLLNTVAGTNFSYMFYSCSLLASIPLLNTAAGTNFTSMFQTCSSLIFGALAGTTRVISYASCKLSATELNAIYTALGRVGSGAVTFQITGDTVTKTAHGLIEGQPTAFNTIASTTGITNNTVYYVRNPAADTFQLSATPTGAIIDLAGANGTGNFVAQVITVTGNYGVTGDDPTIATAKGWTVTG